VLFNFNHSEANSLLAQEKIPYAFGQKRPGKEKTHLKTNLKYLNCSIGFTTNTEILADLD